MRGGGNLTVERAVVTRGGGTVRPFLSPATRGRRQRQVASPVRERARQRGRHGSERESEIAWVRERVRLLVFFYFGSLPDLAPPPFNAFSFFFWLNNIV